MNSKIIFFEGQPGSGKSTLSQYIYQQIKLNGHSVYWMDEYEHDGRHFGEFWKVYQTSNNNIVDILLKCWEDLIKKIQPLDKIILMDSAFFSYTLYLLNLELSKDEIKDYFEKVNILLSSLNPSIILLKGDTQTIISRACRRRGDTWANSTIQMIEKGPYQKSRNRIGFQGMVDYFADAQKLYLELMPISKFPILEVDVTKENWYETEGLVLSWLGYERLHNDLAFDPGIFQRYCGNYQVPATFPDQGEKLEIVIEDESLVLKGTYWKDYKLIPRSETHFLIRGIPMELNFKIQEEQVIGFDYTFIDRKTYSCTRIHI